jgi:hypothetical protein
MGALAGDGAVVGWAAVLDERAGVADEQVSLIVLGFELMAGDAAPTAPTISSGHPQ